MRLFCLYKNDAAPTPKSRFGRLKQGCGIRIGSGFSDFDDPDPYLESGSRSRGKKIKKFQWKNALFCYLRKKFLPLKRYKIALTTFEKKN
jgi:hypothetical protein